MYVQCLAQLSKIDGLFLLSHDLVDVYPTKAISWYAVGTYYLVIKQYVDAKAYFSKATITDATFSEAWVGYAHSFSLEGEHDQALSAYCHAARLLPQYNPFNAVRTFLIYIWGWNTRNFRIRNLHLPF